MPAQLDILALEPFYGGMRRTMLEIIVRCSRHRWTVLKLPPRRMERRLSAAAHWFSEQLTRHWVGRLDLLYTSDALNLADLYRLSPTLMQKPAVVYFHANQLPEPNVGQQGPHDLVNLSTATAANEIWFNSLFHLKNFLAKASALVDRHAELSSQSPMASLTAKAHLMPPPVDLSFVRELGKTVQSPRKERLIFIDTRDADMPLLNEALATVARRGEPFDLITVGPVEELSANLPRRTLSETDDVGQIQAMYEAGIYLSAKPHTPCDLHAIRALTADCWPIVPKSGVYLDLIPKKLHSACLYDADADTLASRIQDHLYIEKPTDYAADVTKILKPFDAIAACKAIDQRLDEIAKNGVAKA